MAATAIVTVTDAWAEVIDVLETTWVLQNISDNLVLVFMKTTSPAADDLGHILSPGDTITSTEYGAGDIWVRNGGSSLSSLSNVGVAGSLSSGVSTPQVAITK